MNIIIYTKAETLMHKQGELPDDDDFAESGYYFWHLPRIPQKLIIGDKIYFAVKGYIRGFFKVYDIDPDDGCDIEFHSGSWKKIKPIPTRSFQGFKYADKVPELK